MGAVEWIGIALVLVCVILVAKKFIQPKKGCGCGCGTQSEKKTHKARVK